VLVALPTEWLARLPHEQIQRRANKNHTFAGSTSDMPVKLDENEAAILLGHPLQLLEEVERDRVHRAGGSARGHGCDPTSGTRRDHRRAVGSGQSARVGNAVQPQGP
jgi:hypothetical protein